MTEEPIKFLRTLSRRTFKFMRGMRGAWSREARPNG